jgi:hypothetical protein
MPELVILMLDVFAVTFFVGMILAIIEWAYLLLRPDGETIENELLQSERKYFIE